jgi:hypothetical protein
MDSRVPLELFTSAFTGSVKRRNQAATAANVSCMVVDGRLGLRSLLMTSKGPLELYGRRV